MGLLHIYSCAPTSVLLVLQAVPTSRAGLKERQAGCRGQACIFKELNVLIHPLGAFRAQASHTELELNLPQRGGRFQMLLELYP